MQNINTMSEKESKNFFLLAIQELRKTSHKTIPSPIFSVFLEDGSVKSSYLTSDKSNLFDDAATYVADVLANSKHRITTLSIMSECTMAKAETEFDAARMMHWRKTIGSLEDCPYVKVIDQVSFLCYNIEGSYNFLTCDKDKADSLSDIAIHNGSVGGSMFDMIEKFASKIKMIYTL